MFTNHCRNNTKDRILNEEKPKCVLLYKGSSLARDGIKLKTQFGFTAEKMYKIT